MRPLRATGRAGRLAALAIVASSLAPLASAQLVPERLDDLRLATAVRLALVADAVTRPLDVGVTARRGAVELAVESGPFARDVARVARDVPGVRQLVGLDGVLDAPPDGTVEIRRAEPARSEPEAEGPLVHTVRRGDTLYGIARRYDTTLREILRLNNRRSTSIRVGERLRVR